MTMLSKRRNSNDGYYASPDTSPVSPSPGGSILLKAPSSTSSSSYPHDTYTLLALYDPFRETKIFRFGLVVFLFQCTLLHLMVLNVIMPAFANSATGSWFVTGEESGYLPRVTKVVSIAAYLFFPGSSLSHITSAVELFPSSGLPDPFGLFRGLRFSCALRFLHGLTSTLAIWFVMMASSNLVEIIINVAAINFISSLDKYAFELAKSGKYGPVIAKAAETIARTKLPSHLSEEVKHKRYEQCLSFTAYALFVATAGAMLSQGISNLGEWAPAPTSLTRTLRVEFKDTSRAPYRGCYHINNENKMKDGRHVYEADVNNQDSNGKIGYCLEKRRWLLFEGGASEDPCDAFGKSEEIAHSAKTDSYDIKSTISKTWYTSLDTPIDDMYFIESDNLGDSCGAFLGNGICHAHLNTESYQYDGGDCCATSCVGESCGKGVGEDTGVIEYTNCVDPAMTAITIQLDDQTLSEEHHLGLICERNGVSHTVFRHQARLWTVAMVEPGYSCKLEFTGPQWGSTKYSVYQGYNYKGLPISKTNDEDHGEKEDESFVDGYIEETFVIPPALLSRENKLIKTNMPLFANMTYLNLQGIQLTGTFPTEFGLMTSLRSLDLKGIRPAASRDWKKRKESPADLALPSEIGLLTNLSYLHLSKNRFPAIPRELWGLKGLRWLDLSGNQLKSIDSDIGKLDKTLGSLDLSGNQLTSIPIELGQMKVMSYLDLSDNKLKKIPSELGQLTQLSGLKLSGNQLKTLPSELKLLTGLKYLEVANSQLTSIPNEILCLPGLEKINLKGNGKLRGQYESEVPRDYCSTSL